MKRKISIASGDRKPGDRKPGDRKPGPHVLQLKRLRVDQRPWFQIYMAQRCENGVPVQKGGKYIGRSKEPDKRRNAHKRAKGNCSFHQAIRAYGYTSFTWDVLDTARGPDWETAYAEARVLEDKFIRLHNTVEEGYNDRYEISSDKPRTIEFYKAQYRWLNPYACRHCTARRRKKYRLKEHIYETHGGDPSFACYECGQAFGRKHVRKVHMRIHTDERAFHCNVEGCNERFKQSSTRNKHVRTHTGERPYHCEAQGCNRKFSNSGGRDVHMRSWHPVHCLWCNKPFATEARMRDHGVWAHGIWMWHV